jgi:TonB family protein
VEVPTGQTLRVAQQATTTEDQFSGIRVADTDFAIPEIVPLPGRDSVYSLVEVDSMVVRDPMSAAPAYPEDMRQKGLEGSAIVQYVVDTTGRADMLSFKVLRSTNTSFATAVREALPQMRYTPAKIGERRVRQLVEQEFSFKLEQAVSQSAKRKAKPDGKPDEPPP